jgi:hypothetical protein
MKSMLAARVQPASLGVQVSTSAVSFLMIKESAGGDSRAAVLDAVAAKLVLGDIRHVNALTCPTSLKASQACVARSVCAHSERRRLGRFSCISCSQQILGLALVGGVDSGGGGGVSPPPVH